MWTQIYLSQNRESAGKIKKLLEDAGILTRMRILKAEDKVQCHEILVTDADVEKAHSVIIEGNL